MSHVTVPLRALVHFEAPSVSTPLLSAGHTSS